MRRLVSILSAAFLAALPAGTAEGQLTWNSAGPSNNWSTAAGNENWQPGGIVWTQNADAIFNGTAETVTVATANTFNNLTFGVNGFGIANGAGSLLLANDRAGTITVTNAGDTASIAETIADNSGGASSLTKAGLGTLRLNSVGDNTYSGGTNVAAGTLVAADAGSLGTGAVVNNATLELTVPNVTYTGLSASMSGAGIVNVTSLGAGSNTLTLSGNYSGFTGVWNLGVAAAAGAGKARMDGLDNAATTTNVLPHATLYVGGSVYHGSIVLHGGDTGEALGQLRLEGVANWMGTVTLAGNMATDDPMIGGVSSNVSISGQVLESGGSRDLVKGGSGAITLSHASNSFTGALRILRGTISAASINNSGINSTIGAGNSIVLGQNNAAPSATLRFTGAAGGSTNRAITIVRGSSATAATQTLENSVAGQLLTVSGPVAVAGVGTGAFTLGLAGVGDGSLIQAISSGPDLGILKTGSGKWTISGANTYTGATLVDGGRLKAGGASVANVSGAFGLRSAVRLANAAGVILDITGFNTEIGSLSGGGAEGGEVKLGAATLTVGGDHSSPAEFAGVITGTGGLTKIGAGTLTLSGVNGFTGPTLISQGTLRILPGTHLTSIPSGLKIMPLGDSITNGGTTGYRSPLYTLLNPVAPSFQFVGDSTSNPGILPSSPINQRYHSGHSSYSVNDLRNNLDGLDTATFDQFGGESRDPHGGFWLIGGNGTGRAPIFPDAVLLLAAANDISRVGMNGVQGRIESLLNKLVTLRPNARVFLAKSPPITAHPHEVVTINSIFTTVAANFQAAGNRIILVDLNAGFPANGLADGTHPNSTGYNWMADRWYEALVESFTHATDATSMALATTSSVTVAAGSRIEGSGQIGGSLNVAGTVAPGIGVGVLAAGATNLTGAYACELDSTSCDQLVVAGNLALGTATLAITPLNPATAASYVIATWTGNLSGTFSTVTGLPAGYVVRYDTATKRILVATAFEAWRLSKGLNSGNSAPSQDPDGDGAINLAEFGRGGNPLDASDRGVSVGEMQDVAGQSVLTLTIAARSGVTFVPGANQAMTASVDGVTYQVEGSHDLATWTVVVTEVTPAQSAGLPPAPAGYEYHTFRTSDSAGQAKGFLRLKLAVAP